MEMISQELNASPRLFLGITPKQFICKLSTAGTGIGPKTRPKGRLWRDIRLLRTGVAQQIDSLPWQI